MDATEKIIKVLDDLGKPSVKAAEAMRIAYDTRRSRKTGKNLIHRFTESNYQDLVSFIKKTN